MKSTSFNQIPPGHSRCLQESSKMFFRFRFLFTMSLNLSLGLPWFLFPSRNWEYNSCLGSLTSPSSSRGRAISGSSEFKYTLHLHLGLWRHISSQDQWRHSGVISPQSPLQFLFSILILSCATRRYKKMRPNLQGPVTIFLVWASFMFCSLPPTCSTKKVHVVGEMVPHSEEKKVEECYQNTGW